MRFSLHKAIDADALVAEYTYSGRVSISPFIAEAEAEVLYRILRERADWRQVVNSGPERVIITVAEHPIWQISRR